MDAAFGCLVDLGFHGTTTVAVCERAGVSRGTMLHHFPTRQHLLLAAMEDVLLRRVEAFRDELGDDAVDDVPSLLRRLWSAIRGPTFFAWLELAVASRTDPALGAELRPLMDRFDRLVRVTATEILQGTSGEAFASWVPVVFSALNGMALDLLQHDADEVDARVTRFLEAVEVVMAGPA